MIIGVFAFVRARSSLHVPYTVAVVISVVDYSTCRCIKLSNVAPFTIPYLRCKNIHVAVDNHPQTRII